LTSCVLCHKPFPMLVADPRCPCGGVPALPALAPFDPRSVPERERSRGVFRFASALRLPPTGHRPSTLGEATVPVEPLDLAGGPAGLLVLREDLEPGGSVHDVGAALLVGTMTRGSGRSLLVDGASSHALAVARYASRAGLGVHALTPREAGEGRKSVLRGRGARVSELDEDDPCAERTVRRMVESGSIDTRNASQVIAVLGGAAVAFCIVEQLGGAPGAVVCPAGHGALLAGLGAGFSATARAGCGNVPRLFGVQSSRCAPLATAHARGAARVDVPAPVRGAGLAGEMLVGTPLRDVEALRAAEESGGAIVSVDDLALERAVRVLWRDGLKVEPWAALPVAWLMSVEARESLRGQSPTVVVLAAHGIRDGVPLADRFP